MENKLMYVKLLKFNLEYLINCIGELEEVTQSSCSLLKNRAADIIENSISSFLKDKSTNSLNWLTESTNTFLRVYPDNIYKSNVQLLDDELNRLYYTITRINKEISEGA